MKIAVIDKSPSKVIYEKHFDLYDYTLEVFHMSSKALEKNKLYKRDIDLGTETNPFNPQDYDYILLIGADPFKEYTGRTGINDYSGRLVEGKTDTREVYIPCINPTQVYFNPSVKPVLERTVENLKSIFNGTIKPPKKNDLRFITDPDEAYEYFNNIYTMTIPKITPLGFDSETSALYARDGYVLGISNSYDEYQGVYIHSDALDERSIYCVQRLLDQEERDIVFHNLKFDMHMYKYHFGWDFDKAFNENRMHDTMLMHYILDETRGTHGLKSLAMKYTDLGDYDFELEQFKTDYCKHHKIKKGDFTYDLIPDDIMWKYASLDTVATLRLFNFFKPKIYGNERFLWLYQNIMMPGCRFLQRVEDRGVPIDKNRLLVTQDILTKQLNQYTKELYEFPEVVEFEKEQGEGFNPNSVVQLRKLLFDTFGLESDGRLTDTGQISTDAEALEGMADQHPVASILLNIRKLKKLLSTYVEKLLESIDADGCVRTGFNQHITTSGRLSSSGKLNLQQLPRDESCIKACIKPPKGYRVVAHDLTTAEIYYAAVLSGDKNMQQVFINMRLDPAKYPDFHSTIAHMVFQLTCLPKEVKDLFPALRQAAKAISFGINQ